MTQKDIYSLKQKFYEATATPDEERLLAKLLRSSDGSLLEEKERRALLALLPVEGEALPEGFGRRLTQRLEKERGSHRLAMRRRLKNWSVAAAIFLALGGGVIWALRTATADQPIIASQTEPELPPAILPPPIAETPPTETKTEELPSVKTYPPRRKQPRKAIAAITTVETPPSEEEKAEEVQVSPEPQSSPDASLANHLQRTQQSRDRLIAEARSYMSTSCLNRNMPPPMSSSPDPLK